MGDMTTWQADLYALPVNDQLGVLSSTKFVVEQGKHVWINPQQVEALSKAWIQDQTLQVAIPTAPGQWFTDYHFFDGTERTVNWMLVLDALNFCFWAEKGQARWTMHYRGESLNGYWAEAASLKRAVEEGIPLWDATYLSNISCETVAHIFRGTQTIPLLEQRAAHLQEVGRVLLENFSGQFAHAIEQTAGSAVQLVHLLVHYFSSFRDVTHYQQREIRFFKRAQICVADLYGAFGGQQWGKFTDIVQLTAFADYKLPQVLRHCKVIVYNSTLAEQVDNQQLLACGSDEEIEIRAVTIWACELLRRAMHRRGCDMTVAEIDQRLWLLGQQAEKMLPYHRTLTIYY